MGRLVVAATFDLFVEIPSLSLLAGGSVVAELASDRVAVSVQKLDYRSDTPDAAIWNLPAAEADITVALDLSAATPRVRCALPLPEPGESALYRVTILKSGTVLDSIGENRDNQLHPTEEDLLFFVAGVAGGQLGSQPARPRVVPGVQYVVVPAP
jgi:hypothetical protein